MRSIRWRDIRTERYALPESPVAVLVTRKAVGIRGDDSLAEAARIMREEDVSALLVDGGNAVITERDISRSIGAGATPDEPLRYVATPGPLMVDAMLPIAQCAGIMLSEGVRHLVVAMPDATRGVVSLRAMVEVLLRHLDPGVWTGPMASVVPENWLG